MATTAALPKTILNGTANTKDETKEFLNLFSQIQNIEVVDPKEKNCLIEKRIYHLLVFYEHHKDSINRKYSNRIIFSKLPNLCFEEHVEDSGLLVDVLRTIHGLPPIVVPHLVLFLILLGLSNRTLPHSVVQRRNELKRPSFSALTYFLYHAYKKKLTIRNMRLTDLIASTDPLLFSKLVFFADTKSTRVLLQFGLRFELFDKTIDQIHPIFVCAAELLSSFIKKTKLWSKGTHEETSRQKRYTGKMLHFAKNFKLLLLSTANPYEVTSQMIYILPLCLGFNDDDKLTPYFKRFFPCEDSGIYQPPSLKHMCRYAIRTRLHENWRLPYGVWKLPLPRKLSHYLNFSKCAEKRMCQMK